MFHNYFYLKRLSQALEKELKSLRLAECFSQNKDELVLRFSGERDFFIKAALIPEICLLQFPDDFKKAHKNYVDLYPVLNGLSVLSVEVFAFERSFKISLENEYDLIFKMHGSRSNILISHQDTIKDIFKSQLKNDLNIDPEKDLRQHFKPDRNRFNELNGEPKKFLPALGQEASGFLKNRDYLDQNINDQWELMTDLLDRLEHNPIWIYHDTKVRLSLLEPSDGILLETHDPILAANELYRRYTSNHYLSVEKTSALKQVEKSIDKAKNYIEKSSARLEEVKTRRSFEEIANLIMANLHAIPQGSKSVSLHDLYSDGTVEIKLKPTLSAQKNAEQFYRKAKNQKKEIEVIEKNIKSKKQQLSEFERLRANIDETDDLRKIRKQVPALPGKQEDKTEPFFRLDFLGYDILIGKNARQNDELTLKYATKNDLWLHAKDVAGSHVVVKIHPGKNYPEPVIERAAQLAAWYSKRKTDSLCPVIYTPKKFVRKRKGDPPGAMVVEREEVVMVEPKGLY